jgi:sugar phosphate isomerase/epimerase
VKDDRGAGGAMGRMEVVNLKADRPTVEEARKRLMQVIDEARAAGVDLLKIVHGYGSGGSGGAIRDAVRASLRRRRKEGIVLHIVHGERWDPFGDAAREVLERHPEIRRDQDLGRSNEGVTIVVLAGATGAAPGRGRP